MTDTQDTRITIARHEARNANGDPPVTLAQRLRRIDAIERDIERAWRRPYSVLWGSPQLKAIVVNAAIDGAITAAEAEDIMDQYGLRNA